jgi:hypothetical protein
VSVDHEAKPAWNGEDVERLDLQQVTITQYRTGITIGPR